MGDVVILEGVTRLDLPPDRLLEAAVGKLESVVILGFDHDGNEYFASSKADAQFPIYLCERAKFKLLRMVEDVD